MKKRWLKSVIFSGAMLGATIAGFAQGFTNAEYKKALWMTTRMYGGQRSGQNNWLLYNHLPAGLAEKYRGTAFIEDKDTDGYDLSGGWHDCGDHVKFGQTEFYSGYMLLKAYSEFPAGYDDYYSYDYKGYKAGGDWTWEGNKHDPNGIPDILDEVKHGTDFFIKCTRSSSTFYYQVGDGNADHAKWVTATKMQTLPVGDGGQTRSVAKNPADASMASFAGATLALMSKVYRKFDPAYADVCLQHAKYAYDYAKAHPGTIGVGFYPANGNWKDDYATMCAELYWATGTESYKTEALAFSISSSSGSGDIFFNYSFDYTNNGDIAIYNLAKLGKTNGVTVFNKIVTDNYLSKTQADGQYSGGNTGWGVLRYNANSALMVALYQKLNNQTGVHKFIYDNIDYLLGKNSQSYSFVIGFGAKSAQHPHHRNIYVDDQNVGNNEQQNLPIPTKNKQFGYLVGGARNPSDYGDIVTKYEQTEGGIDYNACLVGILGYINSKLAPIDTNKFGHTAPKLGSNQSICGLSSIVLDSKVAVDGKKTFTWQKDGATIQAASTTKNTLTVTAAGVYTCILDSLGKWSTQASVTILGVLPDVNLGADKELCAQTSAALDMGVSGSGIKFEWKKDGAVISNATTATYTATAAGTYRGTITATGCPAKYDEVVITSKLLSVQNDVICSTGKANLAVLSTGGPFEWYSSATSTPVLTTGASYSPTVSATTTYYVKDGSSIAATAGPSSTSNPLSGPQNGGSIGMKFTALKGFTITQIKVMPYVYSCNSGDQVSVTFELKQGTTSLGTFVGNGGACSGTGSTAFYTLNFATAINVPSAGSYTLTPSAGNQLVWFNAGANFSNMDAAGVMDITDDTRDDAANSFPAIFDIKLQAGSTCARTPVTATLDPTSPECVLTVIDEKQSANSSIMIYPNPSSDNFNIQANTTVTVKVVDELGRIVKELKGSGNYSFGNDLPNGVYHVIIYDGDKVISSSNLIKK